MNTTPIFYDADCISSFLKIDRIDLLKNLFKEILMPKQVYDELISPDSYWLVKKNAELLKKEGFLKIVTIEANFEQLKNYNSMISGKLMKPIGKGEAAALSLAITNKGIIASNNLRDIEKIAKKHNIPILTSSIILTALCELRLYSKDEIEKIWKAMQKRNTKLPEKTFEKYYAKLFKKDYIEFNLKKYYEKLIETK